MLDRSTISIFQSDRWRAVTDAFFDATGLSVTIACSDDSCVSRTTRCSLCGVTTEGFAVGDIGCVAETSAPDLEYRATRITCRGGLPCFAARITNDVYLTVGGFFSSTRERKRVFESLVGRGLKEDQARVVVRAIPILSQHQVESYAEMIRLQAEALAQQNLVSDDADVTRRNLESMVEAGEEFAADMGASELATVLLGRLVETAEAVGGVIYLSRPDGRLEVVGVTGVVAGERPGAVIMSGEGVPGAVAAERKAVVVNASTGVCDEEFATRVVGLPVMSDGVVQGVVCLYQEANAAPVPGDVFKRLDGVIRVGATFLSRSDELQSIRRLSAELTQLNELGKAVGMAADIPEIEPIIASVLSKSFDGSVSGLVLSGWNVDRALVSVDGSVARSDIERLMLEAVGRDMLKYPFGELSWDTAHGEVHDGPASQGDWSLLSAEILARDVVTGFVFVAAPTSGAYSFEDRRLLEGIAQHAAVAFGKASMFSRLRSDYARAIAALSVTLDAGEHAEHGHSDRVMDYAMLIGEEVGLGFEEIELLRFAGLLHDIGKAGISEEILLKPSKLTEDEMRRVQGHVKVGATLVEQIEFLNGLAPVIMHHHERWDGTGYPMGLRGEDIPLMARILGVADAYDAMTSDRPYRPRRSYGAARAEMEAGAGTQFDPMLVAALFEALDRKSLGGSTGVLAQPYGDGDILPA